MRTNDPYLQTSSASSGPSRKSTLRSGQTVGRTLPQSAPGEPQRHGTDQASTAGCQGNVLSPSRSHPRKVAHVITRLIVGGAQENTILTAEGLRKSHGYDVTLITGPPLGPEGSLLDGSWRESVKCMVLPQMRRAVNPVRDAIAFFELYSNFHGEKYTIVHTHSSKAGVLGRLAARLARIKVIVHTIHGLPFHPYQNRTFNFIAVLLEKLAAKVSTKIVCVADAMAEQAVAAGVGPRGKFVTIYSGMDLDPFLRSGALREGARRRLGLSRDGPVVGMIARLFPLKGHDYLFAAAREVVRRFPETRFLLVGEGILREKFRRTLRQMGLSDRFVFAGLVQPDRIPEMISAMDILVHTSLREGLAKALPQAMACGKPVVSFDLDGAREVVKDGLTGHLVRPGDVEGLTSAVCRLLSNADSRTRMGENGRRLVDPAFRKEVMVERISALYEALQNQSGGDA